VLPRRQGAAADTKQLIPTNPWYDSGGERFFLSVGGQSYSARLSAQTLVGKGRVMPTCQRAGGELYYEVRGSGPPIVLGHSFLCSGEMWGPQLEPLAEHHQVLNLDLRGHGKSGQAIRPFGMYELVEDVLAVLDREGVGRAVWAGLSIGGMVALRAALVAEDRVSGLILLDTHAGRETVFGKLRSLLMGSAVKAFGLRPLMPEIIRLFFSSDTRKAKQSLIDEWKERFASVHVPSMLQTMQALRKRDSILDRLAEIKVPALVIVGEQDALLPLSYSMEIAAGLTDTSLVVIEKAGHLSSLEQPELVTSAMVSFLEQRFGQAGLDANRE
jgi:3-oxoadipate enol-lactonase